MRSKCLAILIFVSFVLASVSAAERDPNVFYGRSFSSDGDTLFYRVMYPKGYSDNTKKKFPLVLVLHGGDALAKQGQHYNAKQLSSPVAELFAQNSVKDSFPAIVAFPQCEEGDRWAEMGISSAGKVVNFPENPEQTYSGELLESMVKYYIKHYPVDEKRIYLIGLGSFGGSGALDLAARKPKYFAGVISLGGAIHPGRTKSLRKIPLRLYSSDAMTDVPLTLVRDVYIELQAAGAKCCDPVFELGSKDEAECVHMAANSKGFLKWLFLQKKK
ncbi:MAG: hypothetical protein IKP81_07065 [Paludibacteraceae bacterium]|nr:hypothetical protein [Paludibacteraceae bacterium]MBR6104800.1 hypothetical protein [Paludibacteraceae bacterium]